MKALWTILSTLALANLLALIGLVAWLSTSDRLDMGRVHDIRQILSRTITDVRLEQEQEAQQAAAQAAIDAEQSKVGTPPVTATDIVNLKVQAGQVEQERLNRLRSEVDAMQATLRRQTDDLDAKIARLAKLQADWDAERARIAATEGDEQFQKTLTTYSQLKPEQARASLQQLIDANETDQVVSYLNGMADRIRTQLVDEFIKTDPTLAASLLERLRTRGVEPRGPEDAP